MSSEEVNLNIIMYLKGQGSKEAIIAIYSYFMSYLLTPTEKISEEKVQWKGL